VSAPREHVLEAMRLGEPEGIPVMCQMALGHILLNTRVDPVDFFLRSETYAEGLLAARELYDFDGILIHKPGRENGWEPWIEEIERDGECPIIRLSGGAHIECRWDDDPYYIHPEGWTFPRPGELDPADPLGGLPEPYRHWCLMKATFPWRDPGEFPAYYYACLDRVLEASGGRWSVHGEVRSALDGVIACAGIEETMMALLTEPEIVEPLLEYFAERSASWAVAQIRRGADAIKISAPFAGGGFISREHYERFVQPYEREIGRRVREAGGIAYIHTCGAIGDRLDLMEATGVHGLECLDPPPLGNVELAAAKEALAGRLFIKGNVDSVNTLLDKDVAGVREDVRQVLATGSPGGGFLLSTACSIAPPVKPENIRAMVEEARLFTAAR
jgi:hypothetical protein